MFDLIGDAVTTTRMRVIPVTDVHHAISGSMMAGVAVRDAAMSTVPLQTAIDLCGGDPFDEQRSSHHCAERKQSRR